MKSTPALLFIVVVFTATAFAWEDDEEDSYTSPEKGVPNYDLSSSDLDALCKVVDPEGSRKPAPRCIYMKWVPCRGADPHSNRPCGRYQQAECNNRKKRSVDEQFVHPNDDLAFINFPHDKANF